MNLLLLLIVNGVNSLANCTEKGPAWLLEPMKNMYKSVPRLLELSKREKTKLNFAHGGELALYKWAEQNLAEQEEADKKSNRFNGYEWFLDLKKIWEYVEDPSKQLEPVDTDFTTIVVKMLNTLCDFKDDGAYFKLPRDPYEEDTVVETCQKVKKAS